MWFWPNPDEVLEKENKENEIKAKKEKLNKLLNSEDYQWDKKDGILKFSYSIWNLGNVARDYYINIKQTENWYNININRTKNFFFWQEIYTWDINKNELNTIPEIIIKMMKEDEKIKNKETLKL